MKFFKRPAVAVLITAIIVLASTALSVNIKLGEKCQQVIDGFYNGVYYNGAEQKSIASQLRNIYSSADEIAAIAGRYDIDTEEILWCIDDLKLGLTYSPDEASYLYFCYDELIGEVKALEGKLRKTELEDRDAEALEQYISSIKDSQSAIESSGYNESVREFLREYMRFPAEHLADFSGVQLPEYFS